MAIAGWMAGALGLGWLVGALANWAADRLPGTTKADRSGGRRGFVLWHYWTLGWYPFRHGICPHCGQPRPLRAPLLEAGMAVLWAAARLRFQDELIRVVVSWVYIACLLSVAVIDLEHRRVLNSMVVPAAFFALLVSLLPGSPEPLEALLGGTAGLAFFLILALIGRGGLGAGDVKLAGVIGLMTGYPLVLSALAIGVLAGGLAAFILVVFGRRDRRSYMAYAPYLAFGALVALFGVVGGG